ncbi:hypothetical protein [Xinfangfangia pollutisoli]|uniref:hypothetical protein n=1 Tax=Xinfangfangia pollutisoli TaxID=2865960 RepID=UPI001CD75E94|nr:hypothetical protein [Xinfangfangia pollutisoli]
MRKTVLLFALLTAPLAGCMQDPTSRGLAGAATGALLADVTDNDMVTGAVIGGLAGVASCGIELGLPPCQSRY